LARLILACGLTTLAGALWLLLLAALIGGGFWIYEQARDKRDVAAKQQQARNATPSILVAVAPARVGNIPVYLNGLAKTAVGPVAADGSLRPQRPDEARYRSVTDDG